MPFKSQAQRRFMFAAHPKLAAEFQAATPAGVHLPAKVGPPAPVHSIWGALASKIGGMNAPSAGNPGGGMGKPFGKRS